MLNSRKKIATLAFETPFDAEYSILLASGNTLGRQALNLSVYELGRGFCVANTIENPDLMVTRQVPSRSFWDLTIEEISFDSKPKKAKEDPVEELNIEEISFDSKPKKAKEDPVEELNIEEISFDSKPKEIKKEPLMEDYQTSFEIHIDTICLAEITFVGIHECRCGIFLT